MRQRPHREMSIETRVYLRERREALITRKREARARVIGRHVGATITESPGGAK